MSVQAQGPVVPPGYPSALTDEQLKDAIRDLVGHATPMMTQKTLAPLVYLPLLELGLIEQSIRTSDKSSSQARRISYVALAVALFTALGGLID